ncbi:MAG: hypothetical protein SF123_03455 [Chloroflexota bacterium]|nr:hypothetical protein [Chloroflexota bacterium]
MDDPNSVNLAILVALYQEGLEKAGENAPYLHRPDSPMPVMFFASQTINLYPPSSLDGEAFLLAMSFFPVLDQVAAAIDFIRSAAAGDRMGTGLALMGFLPGPNPGAFDDIVEGAARNADEIAPEEFADEILGIGGGTNPFAARTGREVSRSGFRNAVLDEYTRAGIGLDWLDDLPTGMVADVHHIVACRLEGDEVDLHAVSVINHIDKCIRLDLATEVEYWRNSNKLKRLHPLVLSAESVRGQHIFMLTEWLTSGVYVSDEFKDIVERNQLTGLMFQPIEVV